jgi:probable F420-dependent oxidoreductase
MRVGIHLPQYGRVASVAAIQRAAQHAESLGFADVWVSDHIVHPAGQSYPSPYLLDPLVTLSWAAAITERIGLGTSVLVLPQHNPLELANMLATIDALSGGRLTIGVGVGWSQREFEALGYDFANRGARTDEIIMLLRTAWRDDPASFHGAHYDFDEIRVVPHPAHVIPIWVGGGSERAYRRGVEHGDGYQIIGVTPEEAKPVIERLRRDRPDPAFTISLRTGWDPQGMEPERIRDELAAFADAGVQHVVSAPWRNNLDDWLRSMDLLAELTRGSG